MYLQGIIVVYDISTLGSFNQLIKWINYVQIVSITISVVMSVSMNSGILCDLGPHGYIAQ